MATKYTDFADLHPLWRAVLAYNTYDADTRENLISATSIMKPTHMVVLERANKGTDKEISLEGMIPSMYGTSVHDRAEAALNETSNSMWKLLGVPKPTELDIMTEKRAEAPIGDHIISGKFDVMFRYDGSQWQLGDFKTMSVWGVMIDKPGKLEEFVKQMSIYRYLNQDVDISDVAVVLLLFTDWSKSDAMIKIKQGYPQKRVDSENVSLWSIDETEQYLKRQEASVVEGLERYARTGLTGYECSDKELWMKKSGWAYYSKAGAKRATKVVDSFDAAEELRTKAKDPSAYVEERKPMATRCSYCSVQDFCPQYAEHLAKGMIKL